MKREELFLHSMEKVLHEYDIDAVDPFVRQILLNKSLKPSLEMIQLESPEGSQVAKIKPGDVVVVKIPNRYPNAPVDLYIKVIESTCGKRGSRRSSPSKDYSRCVFKSNHQVGGDIISVNFCVPENGYCVWKEDNTPKLTQYKPQLYIVAVRSNGHNGSSAPNEAFLSNVFSINTHYRTDPPPKVPRPNPSPISPQMEAISVAQYPQLPPSKLGTVHMHVDGGHEISDIVARFLSQHYPHIKCKTTPVMMSVAGRQRDLEAYKQTYLSHTPGAQNADFQQYTTIPIDPGDSNLFLKSIFSAVKDYNGFVLEVEQVVAKIDRFGALEHLKRAEAHIVESATVGFKRSFTLPYEVHFVLDIDKTFHPLLPIDLNNLLIACSNHNLHFGGWFVSSKENPPRWSYRSNNFEQQVHYESIKSQWQLIYNLVRNVFGIQDISLACTIERVLGVWNTYDSQLLKVCAPVKDAEELACWEAEFEDLQEFWVVTPNFLGDKLQVVLKAMENNLRKNVKYRYFLNSFADACRWQQLVRTLKNSLQYSNEQMSHLMRAVIKWQEGPVNSKEKEYFIAIPNGNKPTEAYCLKRLRDGEVYEGEKLSPGELTEVMNSLSVFIEKKPNILGYMHVPLQAQDISCAFVVRVRFAETALDEVAIRVREYLIGEQVSKHSGEFVSAIGGDFVCLFQSPSVAYKCALNIQSTIVGVQGIALDVGPVARELRASGFDITGCPVQKCADLLDANARTLSITETFETFMMQSITK